jgi:hypothetical protein
MAVHMLHHDVVCRVQGPAAGLTRGSMTLVYSNTSSFSQVGRLPAKYNHPGAAISLCASTLLSLCFDRLNDACGLS